MAGAGRERHRESTEREKERWREPREEKKTEKKTAGKLTSGPKDLKNVTVLWRSVVGTLPGSLVTSWCSHLGICHTLYLCFGFSGTQLNAHDLEGRTQWQQWCIWKNMECDINSVLEWHKITDKTWRQGNRVPSCGGIGYGALPPPPTSRGLFLLIWF